MRNFTGFASYGEKYYVPLLPFLSIPFVLFLKNNWRKWVKYILIVVITISIFHTILGLNPWLEWGKNMNMPKYYQSLSTWQPMGNPIYDYYLPVFVKYGPTSRLMDQILQGQFPPVLRWIHPLSENNILGKVPILNNLLEWTLPFLPFLFSVYFLWREKIDKIISNLLLR